MSNSIKLSEKYGVNPTMAVCWWCGEERGDIALLGELPNDEEAPKRTIVDLEPCDSCREKHQQGIVLVESKSSAIKDGTGRWLVIKPEVLDKILEDPELIANIIEQGIALVSKETFTILLERGQHGH